METILLTSSNIYEYDIRKANISVLRDMNVIDDKTYNHLYNAERMERQIYVGKLQLKDSEVTKKLRKGIRWSVNKFIELNHIEMDNILRVANDAVFVYNKDIKYTKVSDRIEFVRKNHYTSYMKLSNIEILYRYNQMDDSEYCRVLGIRDLTPHSDGFLKLILLIMNTLETGNLEKALFATLDVIDLYENRYYPIEFYKEFTGKGEYRIGDYVSDVARDKDIDSINIDFNLKILYEIKSILLSKLL